MSRYERFMRAVWNSPWSCLAIALFVFSVAVKEHGWEEWFWWFVGFCWAQAFWTRGDKRWLHNKKSGECEVCGKTIRFDRKGGEGASISRPGKKTRWACMAHIDALVDTWKAAS